MPNQWKDAERRQGRHTSRSALVFTGALLAIVLGSVMGVDKLHHHADVHRQAQVVASELEQDASELRIAESQMAGGRGASEARTETTEELSELAAASTLLRGLSDADDVVFAIDRDLGDVASALRSQMAAAKAGDLEAAEEIFRQRTEPAFDAFDVQVEAANDYYETAARQSATLAEIGLWVALLVAGLAISWLSWRHERARREVQAGLEQRLRERVAEVAAVTERHRQLEAMKYSFVSTVSHELRTPLMAIHGSLELLKDGDVGQMPPVATRLVSVAARGTRRLSRLVEDIIDLERLETGHFGFHPAPHDLHDLLVDTVESLAPLSGPAGVALVLHETHADVLCDGDRVQQALVNLVGNAIKFTSPGGAIHLEAVLGDEEVVVTVRDEGRGIPAEQLSAVFDRFHQVATDADQAKGGAGLGLTITRHIIEAQGGRIWVESEYGTGTAFHFTLPLALPEPRVPETLAEPMILRGHPEVFERLT